VSDGSFETHANYSIKYGHVFIARVEWHGICEPSKQVKKNPGFVRVWLGRLGPGSTGSNRVFILDGFLFYLDRSSHPIDRVLSRPVKPVRIYNYALNTHLQPTGLQSLGGGIKSHIPWLKNKKYY
jgi:hypothetical protein